MQRTKVELCPKCGGSGGSGCSVCPRCKGTGMETWIKKDSEDMELNKCRHQSLTSIV